LRSVRFQSVIGDLLDRLRQRATVAQDPRKARAGHAGPHRKMARTSRLRPAQVAQDLGGDPDTIRRWLRQADVDAGRRDGVSTDEKAELARRRREDALLKEERELLRKATVFFAREGATR
jgi:transposase